MKYECGMIEDLLPLYKDGVCSTASAKAIEEHLAECPKCAKMLDDLKDTMIDDMIIKEKENVIDSQSKYFKRKSALAGSIIGGIFAIPILICLIVDLATGNGLGWFFIVLAAMFIPTSLFVVPLIAPKNKMLLTMGSFTFSILFLLAVICIYAGGNWFFVAASSVIFGLTVCFSPFIACRRPVNAYLKNKKGLAVMGACTLTFFLMLICIGINAKSLIYFRNAFAISVPIIALVWIIFAIIRYLPGNGLVKAGAGIAAFSLGSYVATYIILALTFSLSDINEVQVNSIPNIIYVFCGIAIGVIFASIGLLVGKRGGKQ